MSEHQFAIICVRLIGLAISLVAIALLLGNLLETMWDFNPNFFLYYIATQLLKPLVLLGIGILTMVFSKKIGQKISKN